MAQTADTDARTWSTWHQALAVVTAPRSLRRTTTIAAIVGSVFFAMNQLAIVLAGHAGLMVWAKVALTFLTPLVVSNIGMLSATHSPKIPQAKA